MARPLAASESFVGSYSSVHRGRGWSKPKRTIEITLGEGKTWNSSEAKYNPSSTFEFSFSSIEDARLIANAILAEVKACKALA